jgi:serine protease Do
VLTQLRETGHVARGKLGVEFQPVTPPLAKALGLDGARGALVDSVEPGGPAAKAGLESGDVIIRFDGADVKQGHDLPRLVARRKPGTQVELTYLRQHQQRSATVTLDALEQPTAKADTSGHGASPEARVSALGLRLAPTDGGVLVEGVDANGSDEMAPGDVIVAVDGRAVRTPEQVTKALTAAAEQSHPALLKVRRQGHDRFVALEVPA